MDIKEITENSGDPLHYGTSDKNKIHVLYFNYKTHANSVYKLKKTGSGADKVIEKDESFNPPQDMDGEFSLLLY